MTLAQKRTERESRDRISCPVSTYKAGWRDTLGREMAGLSVRSRVARASEKACLRGKSVYFEDEMNATLTELRRQTSKVVSPVIHRGQRVTLTHHGQNCAEIVPKRKIDRRAACDALLAIGPVEFLPRK